MEDKLGQLVNQAALAVNTIDVADKKELKNLRQLLGKIESSSVDDKNENNQKTKQITASAIGTIESILKDKTVDPIEALETVTKSIISIQQMITESFCESENKKTPAESQENESVFCQDDLPLINDFITEALEHLESSEAAMLEIEASHDTEAINKVFRGFHTIKGLAGFLNLTDINSLSHSAENLLSSARDGKITLEGALADIVFESIDMLKDMISALKIAVDNNTSIPKQPKLKDIVNRLAQAVDSQSKQQKAESAKPTQKVEKREQDDRRTETRRATDKKNTEEESIRVSIDRLDRLVNLAGELVISQLMVSEQIKTVLNPEHHMVQKLSQQNKIIRDLQELSMSMRMVPVKPVFQKLTRLVRDLSRKADKKIDLITSGEETELDRTLVDKISDPLVHMVRNSMDHGIEDGPARKEAGKNPTGTIELKAYHKAENIVIEISDDGKGLDLERILKKAIANGVVPENQKITDDEIGKLIFSPGLSTAEKVTDISGRGVGMDVVRKNIESIGGRIDIDTVKGKGTTFIITLPLTLATIDGQVVRIGDSRYIIPVKSIIKSFRPKAEQISTVQNKGEMVLAHDELMRVVRLGEIFGIDSAESDPQKALFVEIEQNRKKACLLVDELLAQQQVVIKSLGRAMGSIKGISGAAIMGDGKVSLILDACGLLELTN